MTFAILIEDSTLKQNLVVTSIYFTPEHLKLGDLKITCPSANDLFVSFPVSKGVGRLWGRCNGCDHLWGSLKNGFLNLFSLLSKSFLHFS
jgi:hypothetical protein